GLGQSEVRGLDGRGEVASLAQAKAEEASRLDRGEDLPEEARRGATAIDGPEDVEDQRQPLVELTATDVDLGRAEPHLDLEFGAARPGRQIPGASDLGEGPGEVAQKVEMGSQVSGHSGEARVVAGLLGKLPCGPEVFEAALMLTQKIEAVPE